MNKKAASYMTLGIIVGLILLLVVVGVYFLFFKDIGTVTEGAVVDATCKASLDLTAARLKGPFRTTLVDLRVQPKCKTYDVLITQKDLDLISGQTDETDENTIKRIIAQIMTTGIMVTTLDSDNKQKRAEVGGLWATVSKGQKQLFEDKAGRFCLPWAVIRFDDEVRKKIPNVDGLFSYLTRENVITSRGDKLSTSYYGYLSNVVGDLSRDLNPVDAPGHKQPGTNKEVRGNDALKEAIKKDSFDTSKDLALLYVQTVSDNWALIGAIAGIVVGTVLIPFTVGTSAALASVSMGVLAVAAVGTSVGGYAIGNAIQGDGYAAGFFYTYYDSKSIKELNCDILK